jgi:hypothetical protein
VENALKNYLVIDFTSWLEGEHARNNLRKTMWDEDPVRKLNSA